MSGSIWVGAKLSRASDRFERRHVDGVSRAARPLARYLPVGHASERSAEPPANKSCAPGRPGARCAGFGRFVGRARRSLQDCRNHRAARGLNQPWREERLGKPWSRSSPPARERREGEAASEAGARRQSRAIGGGSGGLERALRSLDDGRHSGPGKPPALTRGRWNRSWFLEDGGRVSARHVRRGATGSVRGSFVGLARGRKRRGGYGSPENWARPAAALHGEQGLAIGRTEVGHAPSSASSSGAGLPQGGLAPAAAEAEAGFGSFRPRRLVGAAQAARLGNPAICRGARYGMSVAEVGEKHLSRSVEGSREANRGAAR